MLPEIGGLPAGTVADANTIRPACLIYYRLWSLSHFSQLEACDDGYRATPEFELRSPAVAFHGVTEEWVACDSNATLVMEYFEVQTMLIW